MALFNNFKDTIFLKSESELEKQIQALKNILEENPENKEIKKQLMFCELGLKGEKEIEFELKHANIGMYVLHDINLEYEDLKAQIDYIVITPAKTYFIECKNLTGNITVNENGDFIRVWNYNGYPIKEGIYSPITQANRHVTVYKKIRSSRKKGLLDNIAYALMDNYHVPLVVMANSKNILNTKKAPKELKNKIIRSDNLIKYLADDVNKSDKYTRLNKKEMEEKANVFLKNYHKSIDADYERIYREKYLKEENVVGDDLRSQLIEFRKQRASDKNIPAYFVFTNKELEQLIEKKPNSLEELKKLNILSSVKINTHGQDIIEIINSK